MAESATAVALLFDDKDLGGHLRDALSERGARIVHEGALASLTPELLKRTGAQVLVVNLDDDEADELDRLYDVIEGDKPRVVFNDAQASRSLEGWDRARWARHLAVKVLAQGDLDPPRPSEVALAATASPAPAPKVAAAAPGFASAPAPVAAPAPAFQPASPAAGEPDSLAAELEALLAAGDAPLEDEFSGSGSGLKFSAEDALPELHDGFFADAPAAAQAASGPAAAPAPAKSAAEKAFDTSAFSLDAVAAPAPAAPAPAKAAFDLDHLALAPMDEAPAGVAAKAASKRSSLLDAPSSLSLADPDEAPVNAKSFGVQKLNASEFLAPQADKAGSDARVTGPEKVDPSAFLAPESGSGGDMDIKPGLSLELVSMEEAVAASLEYEGGYEMQLGEHASAISRVLALGAAADSNDGVTGFLSQLPLGLRMVVVLVQHLDGMPAETLVQQLSLYTDLTVKVAVQGEQARMGDVLVVPAGHQLKLVRSGHVELLPLDANTRGGTSIDACFTQIAAVFGADARAIVFSGQANEGVAGCQAIHDRGGQVWVERSPDGPFADMVHGIEAERLNSFAGTPAELAARLMGDISKEGRR